VKPSFVAGFGPIVRDTVAPTIAVSLTDATGRAVTGPITDLATTNVTVSGSVDLDVYFVTVNGRAVNLINGRFSVRLPLGVGDNVFIVQAEDDAGNVARSQVSVAYSPVQVQGVANYNSIIASGVAVVLLIVGFVVGYLLSGRGGGPEPARWFFRGENWIIRGADGFDVRYLPGAEAIFSQAGKVRIVIEEGPYTELFCDLWSDRKVVPLRVIGWGQQVAGMRIQRAG